MKEIILIPVEPGKEPIHLHESMSSLSRKLGRSENYVTTRAKHDKPIKFKGEWYYVDYEL